MDKISSLEFLEFMDRLRETYQCPYHPGWIMTIEPFCPIPGNPGVDYALFCGASKEWGAEVAHPLGDPDRCGYHIHIDDLRHISEKKVITEEEFFELKKSCLVKENNEGNTRNN